MTNQATDLKSIQESMLEDGRIISDESDSETDNDSVDFKEFYE